MYLLEYLNQDGTVASAHIITFDEASAITAPLQVRNGYRIGMLYYVSSAVIF